MKPKPKQELIDGITRFWETVDVTKCCKYIRYLMKVTPAGVEKIGDAAGH